MADSTVVFEVVVEGKNIKVVQKQVQDLGKSIDKTSAAEEKSTRTRKQAAGALKNADGAAQHYNRGQKGVAGATANSTKSFSKMRDAIGGGSSGLVGAYATLAANVFAATAVFQALNRSAKLEQLTTTMELMGAKSGQNLIGLGQRLREVTNNAVSLQEALAAASFGTSAGFSTQQLEGLARVAKGASAALGRDLGDSYDRLIRGAAKLEPEILDELGIMVKLNPAMKEYADSVGKTVNQLSQYERSQAFVNAINKQGVEKYGAIADSVKALPLERLLASLENVSKAGINWAVNFARIPTLLNYLADNTVALTGAMVLFASTISKQMLPAVYALPAALAKLGAPKLEKYMADQAKSVANWSKEFPRLGKRSSDAIRTLSRAYEEGVPAAEHFTEAKDAFSKAEKFHTDIARKNYARLISNKVAVGQMTIEQAKAAGVTIQAGKAVALTTTDLQKAELAYRKATAAAKQYRGAQTELIATEAGLASARSGGTMLTAMKEIGGGKFLEGWKKLSTEVSQGFTRIDSTAKLLPKTFAYVGASGKAAIGYLGGAFASVLRFLPLIGLLITFGPMLWDWFKKFLPVNETEIKTKALEKMGETVKGLTERLSKVRANYEIEFKDKGTKEFTKSLDIFVNTLNDLIDTVEKANKELVRDLAAQYEEALRVGSKRRELTELEVRIKPNAEAYAQIAEESVKALEDANLTGADAKAFAYAKTITDVADRLNFLRDIHVKTFVKMPEGLANAAFQMSALKRATDEYNIAVAQSRSMSDNMALPLNVETAQKSLEAFASRMTGIFQDTPMFDYVNQELDKLRDKLSNPDITQTGFEEAWKDLLNLRTVFTALNMDFKAIPDSARIAGDELRKLSDRQDTKYTKALEQLEAVNSSLKTQASIISTLETKRNKTTGEEAKRLTVQLKAARFIQNQLNQTIQRAITQTGMSAGATSQQLEMLLKLLDDYARTSAALEKDFQNLSTTLKSVSKDIPTALMILADAEDRLNEKKVADLDRKISLASDEKVKSGLTYQKQLLQAQMKYSTSRLEAEKELENYTIEQRKQEQKILETVQNTLEAKQKLANLRTTGRLDLTVRQELDAINQTRDIKLELLKLELQGAALKAKYEHLVFQITLKRLKAEATAAKDRSLLDGLNSMEASEAELHTQRMNQLNLEHQVQRDNIIANAELSKASIYTKEPKFTSGGTLTFKFNSRDIETDAQDALTSAMERVKAIAPKTEFSDTTASMQSALTEATSEVQVPEISTPKDIVQLSESGSGMQKTIDTTIAQLKMPSLILPEGTMQLTDSGKAVQEAIDRIVAGLRLPNIVLSEGTIQLTDSATQVQSAVTAKVNEVKAPEVTSTLSFDTSELQNTLTKAVSGAEISTPKDMIQLSESGTNVQKTVNSLITQLNLPIIVLPDGTLQLIDSGRAVQEAVDRIIAGLRLPSIVLSEGTMQLADTATQVQSAVTATVAQVNVPQLDTTLLYIDSSSELQKAVDAAVASIVVPKIKLSGEFSDAAPMNVPEAPLAPAMEEIVVTAPKIIPPEIPKIPGLTEKEKIEEEWEGLDPFQKYAAGANAAKVAMDPFIQSLKDMGTDGALSVAVSEGAIAMSNSVIDIGETFKTAGKDAEGMRERMGAIFSGVGSAIGAIGAIQKAASEQRVAALQSEIDAEKKRDGKSAQSKAKLAALEAKMEKEKRKAFERDKKMRMAQTVINTAGAIMNALNVQPFPVGLALAIVAGAMGVMQLQAISSSSYQGGGSSVGTGPTSISMGERGSTVDLANSKSASGEIGYMRGEQGVGGIGEFKPAFVGAKYRATGGATTGYVVGEQGPELFVPKTPGNIVPNEELTQAPMQNVNFTIQAIDADGVQEVLTKQKGNIIRMIREAANSYGTPFLEQVNVGVYTPQAQGASKA